MTTWFTSDHHFGHVNIIKYCNRPFNSVAHMNSIMESSWNSVVAPDDTIYYLGDFAMQPHMVTEILPRLNGSKILVPGITTGAIQLSVTQISGCRLIWTPGSFPYTLNWSW